MNETYVHLFIFKLVVLSLVPFNLPR